MAEGISIDKSREKLGVLADSFDEDCDKEWKLAIRLGIEALKAVKAARTNNYWTPIPSLPGETED